MTNGEMLIMALRDELDDPEARRAEIYYRIKCPYMYYNLENRCRDINDREKCTDCKIEFLESDVED